MEINLLAKERVGKLEGRNSSVQYEVEEEGSDNFLVTPPWRYARVQFQECEASCHSGSILDEQQM